MRLLLDSNCFLWLLHEPDRIAARVRRRLHDVRVELYLSAVSAWEIGIKVAQGKLRLPVPLAQLVESMIVAQRLRPLAIEVAHALEAASLPMHHRDPFDRMLVAQARREGLTLVTADRQLEPYDVKVLWAR